MSHQNHDIQHYACSDAWEPPELNVQTSCTILDSDSVQLKHPAIPGGKIEAGVVYPLQFMR